MWRVSDDPTAELDEQETFLPKLAVGDQVWSPDKLDEGLDPARRSTPRATRRRRRPRYTEASLVKRLEEEGIGRPSTYAPTVATIQRRGYVSRQGKALVPSFTAFAVTRLLRDHFGDYVDIGFTAEMEEILDQISNGERDWLDFLREFYRGDKASTAASRTSSRTKDERSTTRSSISAPIPTAACRSACASAATARSCSSAAATTGPRVAARRSRAGRSHDREGAGAAEGQGTGAEVAGVDPTTGQPST